MEWRTVSCRDVGGFFFPLCSPPLPLPHSPTAAQTRGGVGDATGYNVYDREIDLQRGKTRHSYTAFSWGVGCVRGGRGRVCCRADK